MEIREIALRWSLPMGPRPFALIALVALCVLGSAGYVLFVQPHSTEGSRPPDDDEAQALASASEAEKHPIVSPERASSESSRVEYATRDLVDSPLSEEEPRIIPGPDDPHADPAIGIEGRILNPSGDPLEGIFLSLHAQRPDAFFLSSNRPPRNPESATDSEGMFRIRGLRSFRSYTLWIDHPEYVSPGPLAVDVAQGVTELGDIVLSSGGAIEGKILRADGGAIPGAFVFAESVIDPNLDETAVLEAKLRRLCAMTTSDDLGHYRLAGLAAGRYEIRAMPHQANEKKSAPILVGEREQVSGVDLRFEPGHGLHGVVLDDESRPIRDAKLVLINTYAPDQKMHAESNEEGEFSFPEVGQRPNRIDVRADGFAPTRVKGAHPGSRPCVIRLNRFSSLRGQVLTRSTGVAVDAFDLVIEKPNQREGWEVVEGLDRRHVDHGQGVFQVEDIAPGKYRIRVHAQGFTVGVFAPFQLLAGQTHALEPYALDEEVKVQGLVVERGKETPVPEARLTMRRISPSDPEQNDVAHILRSSIVTSDENGQFEWRGLCEGRLVFEVFRSGFAPYLSTWEAVRSADPPLLRVELSPGGGILGKVLDHRGRPVAGQLIEAVGPEGAETKLSSRSDDQGLYRFSNLSPGTYRLSRSVDWNRFEPLRLGAMDSPSFSTSNAVIVREGEVTAFDFSAEALAALEGMVVSSAGPVEGAKIYVERDKVASRSDHPLAMTDSQGRFSINGLSPGAYILVIVRGDSAAPLLEPVDLARGAQELTFQVPGGSLKGRVMSNQEGVSGARIRLRSLDQGASFDRWFERSTQAKVTGEDGSFIINGMLPGLYELQASHGQLIQEEVQQIRVANDPLLEPVILPLFPGGVLRGKIQGAVSGDELSGLMIYLRQGQQRVTQRYVAESATFEFRGLKPGDYTVEVESNVQYEGKVQEISLERGETRDVLFELTPKNP